MSSPMLSAKACFYFNFHCQRFRVHDLEYRLRFPHAWNTAISGNMEPEARQSNEPGL